MISKDGLVDLTRWMESTRTHDLADWWRAMQTLPWYTWMLLAAIPLLIVWIGVDAYRRGDMDGRLLALAMVGTIMPLAVILALVSTMVAVPAATTVGEELEHAYGITDLDCASTGPCRLDDRYLLPDNGETVTWRAHDGTWHMGMVIVRGNHVGIIDEGAGLPVGMTCS